MAILRTGIYGDYYGNTYYTSGTLTVSQMRTNAQYIYSALLDDGWSVNAICAMLGNMQAESGINPGRWQSDRVEGETSGHGYSLVQWTPYTKYTNWCSDNSYIDPSEMDTALARIKYEVANGIQWSPRAGYTMSFSEFKTSTEAVATLAKAFLLCYERPADQSTSVQNYRASLAESWYEYLIGVPPTPPGPTPGGNAQNKRNKFKFILFKSKRRIYG